MELERLKWGVPGCALEALGIASSAELFSPLERPIPRAQVLAEDAGQRRVRFPLPGTPDLRGNLTGKPRELGTGWVQLTAYSAPWGDALRCRLTRPRSASLAEREWNLLCHLRSAGIGMPEPLLVGARGRGFVARRSFLVVREVEDGIPLARWLRTDGIGAERERGLRALGLMLAGVVRAGVWLPGLRMEHVRVVPSGAGGCEGAEVGGVRRNRMPGVALVDVGGGELRGRITFQAAERMLGRLKGELERVLTEVEMAGVMEAAEGAGSATPCA